MEGFEVHGIDVSRYQGVIDWKLVEQQDIDFVFIKATEGNTLRDTQFHTNWNALSENRMRRGAYHFFRPTVDAVAQANNFTKVVKIKKGDLPPTLDIEVLDGVSKSELITSVKSWLAVVESKYGCKPIIYTNMKFYNEYLAGHFDDYPLWIARYNSQLSPKIEGNQNWDFWQYGNRGKLEGIKGDVDFNVFRGDLLDLEMLTERKKDIGRITHSSE